MHFRRDDPDIGALPADARGEASYLGRRLITMATRLERNPAIRERGVGKTPLIPKEILEPAGRVHLAAAGRYNQALEATETLTDVLNDLTNPKPPAP